jgi:predicted Zn finger-like uncharacterized protein
MITRCPSCHTHFRVHAEQLAVRAGHVRCGKCSRIFNAREHLVEETALPRPLEPIAEFEFPGADTAAANHVPASAMTQTGGARVEDPAIVKAADAAAETIEPAAATPTKVETEAASGGSSFDFGPIAAPARSVRRWPWLLGALLLLFALVAQAAYHYRSAITLLFPETKPYASALCARLGCDLPLPRRIEMMSIEASDLQADTTNPNVMVLSATIKNRAVFNQQHPLLELTLTDAQDQPVVRRVLAPQDYLGKAVNTQAGFAANSETAIKVFIEGSQVKATGYRLYLFYP